MLAIILKDMRVLARDRAGCFVTIVFPLIYAVFLGIIFSSRADLGVVMTVALVDEDGTPASSAFVARLRQSPAVLVRDMTRDQSEQALRDRTVSAVLLIPAGFGGPAPRSEIQLLLAEGRSDQAQDVQRLLLAVPERSSDAAASAAASPTLPLTASGRGGAAENRPRNPYELAFPLGMTWSVLGCTASFALSPVAERARGTLVRLHTAPVRRWQIVAGKAGACFVTTVAVGMLLVVIAVLAFGVRPGSLPLLAAALVATSLSFVGIMMLLSVLGRTERSAGGITWTVLLAMAMAGGSMVPHFLMPLWMQQLADLSPVRWAVVAMEGAVWRGYTLTEMLTPCAVLLAVGAGSFGAAAAALRWSP